MREATLITVDEHMNEYQPSKKIKERAESEGEPIPVVYIPRKPHPNGLLEYLYATYVENPVRNDSVLPYIVDIKPHLQVGDVNPISAVLDFLPR